MPFQETHICHDCQEQGISCIDWQSYIALRSLKLFFQKGSSLYLNGSLMRIYYGLIENCRVKQGEITPAELLVDLQQPISLTDYR